MFKYILVHVYIGVPIKLFFCTKVRGGGESKQILREYGFKKTLKITDDPLQCKELFKGLFIVAIGPVVTERCAQT